MVTKKKSAAGEGVEKNSSTASKKSASVKTKRPARKTSAAAAQKEQKAADTGKQAATAKEVDLLGLQQMASILRLHPLQLKQMAQTGKVPAVVVDGEWRFNKDLVQEALRRRSLGR